MAASDFKETFRRAGATYNEERISFSFGRRLEFGYALARLLLDELAALGFQGEKLIDALRHCLRHLSKFGEGESIPDQKRALKAALRDFDERAMEAT